MQTFSDESAFSCYSSLDLRGCCGVLNSISLSMTGKYSSHNLQLRGKKNISSPFQPTTNKHLCGLPVASDTGLMEQKLCSKL